MLVFEQLCLHRFTMPLKFPFQNSTTTVTEKKVLIVELIDPAGTRGYGECVAFDAPWYTEETIETAQHIIANHIWPMIKTQTISHPNELNLSPIRRNHMAKTAIEGAVWDLYAKKQRQPLYQVIGGRTNQVPVGAAIGIQPDYSTLSHKIQQALNKGFQRIKLKVKPGYDIKILEQVRRDYPDLSLMVDANSAYTLQEIDHLKQFDYFNLLMIEQPLAADDFLEHAVLQQQIKTPICLDESIHTLEDVKVALTLKSCQVISIKLAKVGGFRQAITIHDYCQEQGIPVWCGGMLEAGIGRAQSLALATLPNFYYPADPGPSNRYWQKDIIQPEIEMEHGIIKLPDHPGIGYQVELPPSQSECLDSN
ncbi:o-succinylbenzoate synthase [Gracilibacillus alcaliphilus]|uniref:o-succinylbenzoate synthase n=1 Tax=Gracilibacillus alcaliphilus TaxID=1401441 RepID=UPI00195AD12E|nr:o-succinylbenzoate synthase [Gracilibacillus alcaliphilus]MBM7677247.1 O-succinylbenzoate synthase [Gracilibacillus alcaliphilus]